MQILVQKFHYSVFHSTSLSVSCGKISRLDNELERRAVTYTLWNQSTIKAKRRSWHPLTFDYADAAPQKLRETKVGNTTLKTSDNASNKTNHNLACSMLQLPCSLISQEINHVYNEYEQHTEFCHINSKVAPCFLYARKFSLGAAMCVLREGMVGSYDVTAILPDIFLASEIKLKKSVRTQRLLRHKQWSLQTTTSTIAAHRLMTQTEKQKM